MSKFTVKFDPDRGKGLFATEPIFKGEIIFEEKPLISSQFLWNKEYKYDACEFCLSPLETAEENVRRLTGDHTIQLPYIKECCITDKSKHRSCVCGAQYCSEECRVQAWQTYHSILCPSNSSQLKDSIVKLCDTWKSFHYPPETASIMLLVKILASIKQSPNSQDLINSLNEFSVTYSKTSERLVCKLLGERFQEQLSVLREMVKNVLYDNSLEHFFTDEGFICLVALISQNGQGIGTSPFSKWAENSERYVANEPEQCLKINQLVENLFDKMDEVSGPFLNNEGSGLFKLQCIINHSCDPNAQVLFPFNNHTLAVKAIENISPGEEILTCYLDECMQYRSRHSRVKYLQENYLFTCKCRKCESQINDPDVTSEEENDDLVSDDDDEFEDMNCD